MNTTTPSQPLSNAELPSRELEILRLLQSNGIGDVYGEPISRLIETASRRLAALHRLLEAESAFVLENSPRSESEIESAEAKCDEALKLLEEITYPEDSRFDTRRRAVLIDIRRAKELRASLGRWIEIRSRIRALDEVVKAARSSADTQASELESAIKIFKEEADGKRATLVAEIDAILAEAANRQNELRSKIDDAMGSVDVLSQTFTTGMGELLGIKDRLASEETARSKELADWRNFTEEAVRAYRALSDAHALEVAPALLDSLLVIKEGLPSSWKDIAASMCDQLREQFCLVRQTLVDMEGWQRLNEQIRTFPQEVHRLSQIGVTNQVEAVLAGARSTLAVWAEHHQTSSLLKTAAGEILNSMERQKCAAIDSFKNQHEKDVNAWLTIAETYLPPRESGDQNEGMERKADPPSALLCIARAERSVSELSDLGAGVHGGELYTRLHAARERALRALPHWIARSQLDGMNRTAQELLARWKHQNANDALDFLSDSASRRMVDELALAGYMLKDLALPAYDMVTLRSLINIRKDGVRQAHDNLESLRALQTDDDTILERWHLVRQAKRLDPDLPGVDSLLEEMRAGYERFRERFGKQYQNVLDSLRDSRAIDIQGARKALTSGQSALRELRKMLGSGGEYARDLDMEVAQWKKALGEFESFVTKLGKLIDLPKHRQRNEGLGILLDEAGSLLLSGPQERVKDFLRAVLPIAGLDKVRRPYYAYRYKELISEAEESRKEKKTAKPPEEILDDWKRSGFDAHNLFCAIRSQEKGVREKLVNELDKTYVNRRRLRFVLSLVAIVIVIAAGGGLAAFFWRPEKKNEDVTNGAAATTQASGVQVSTGTEPEPIQTELRSEQTGPSIRSDLSIGEDLERK